MSEGKRNISEKMARLDELLSWFDSDDFELENALKVYEEAKKLADEIEQDLVSIKNDINVISEQFDRDKE